MKFSSVVILVLVAKISTASFAKPPSAAHLTGMVTDVDTNRVAGVQISIEGRGTTRTVVTDKDGLYNIDVPEGVYEIRFKVLGYCPGRRARISAESGTSIVLNFTVIVCSLDDMLVVKNGQYQGEVERYRLPFKEESFFLGSSPSPPLNLLVQFGERQERNGIIEYKGFTISGSRALNTTVSYNLLTVHADTVCLRKRTLQLQAAGNVVIEDGHNTSRADLVTVEFKSGRPVVSIIR